MIISVLTRRTRLTDRGKWQAALETVLPSIRQLLQSQPGFVSVQYLWNVDEDGEFAQITTWEALEDCRRYVRGGAAAAVATLEDPAVPTAAHPHGAWVRKNYEVAD